ncbi:hypothetical protein BMASAVP1_A0981 [Burkholderia mallei SAVP1]|nr:hypothetical protein BMASAVP1_A0981 [Burkholderia mallei SAVP1]
MASEKVGAGSSAATAAPAMPAIVTASAARRMDEGKNERIMNTPRDESFRMRRKPDRQVPAGMPA